MSEIQVIGKPNPDALRYLLRLLEEHVMRKQMAMAPSLEQEPEIIEVFYETNVEQLSEVV